MIFLSNPPPLPGREPPAALSHLSRLTFPAEAGRPLSLAWLSLPGRVRLLGVSIGIPETRRFTGVGSAETRLNLDCADPSPPGVWGTSGAPGFWLRLKKITLLAPKDNTARVTKFWEFSINSHIFPFPMESFQNEAFPKFLSLISPGVESFYNSIWQNLIPQGTSSDQFHSLTFQDCKPTSIFLASLFLMDQGMELP